MGASDQCLRRRGQRQRNDHRQCHVHSADDHVAAAIDDRRGRHARDAHREHDRKRPDVPMVRRLVRLHRRSAGRRDRLVVHHFADGDVAILGARLEFVRIGQ